MKIGIDIRTLMDARYSGVPEYTLSLIKEILKLDDSNEYQLFYNSFKDIRGLIQAKCGPTPTNVEIVDYRYPNKVLNYFLFKFLNWPKIDEQLRVDLYLMPHINFIGLSGRVKSLITIHDLSFLRYPEFFSWRKNFWHRMINVRKLVKRFDSVVAASESTKKDIVELCGVETSKIKVIYAGVGGEYRRMTKQIQNANADGRKLAEVKNKYSLPDKFILYLGTIEPRKNIDGIIRAYNELRARRYELGDYKLVIAGGTGWKCKNIFAEWSRSKFKDGIIFLDYVDGEDKVYLYNLASAFVYPSFYEGFGFPPLEAMACGLPVVASFASSLPEVVGDSALLVDPYNVNDIARALAEILTDNHLRDKLIVRGLEQAKKFSWEKAAKDYLDLFISYRG